LDRAKQHFRLYVADRREKRMVLPVQRNVRKIHVKFALAEMQWNKLAYICKIKNTLFYKVAWLMLGNLHAVLYSEGFCVGKKNVGRGENVRAVRKVKKRKIRGGINVAGGNVCTH
jgi:hypothetical protein